MKIYQFLAQTELPVALEKIVGILNSISMVLFFGALIVSGLMYASGRTEHLTSGITAAGIGALAWVIVKTIFQTVGTVSF